MIKKREAKVNAKKEHVKSKGLTKDDRKIKNEIRSKRKEANKSNKNEDEFDGMLEKYQNKVLKRMKVEGGESGTTPFEEVDVE